MNRDGTIWSGTHTSGLVALAAFPLVLTTSAVGVTLTSAGAEPEQPPTPPPSSSAVDLDAPPAGESTDTTRAAFSSHRPWLGSARAGDIPWAALGAYQRAAGILGKVEPGCGVSWQLLAAVGQVESEHGQARGGEPGADGVVRPAIVGAPLNGTGPRPTLKDTDGGRIDGDPTWDRAVGPMQLLPGMWQVAGVDGDGDGERSEQDLDDAALAAGVYLCATGPDLDDPERAAQALVSYNGSEGYADQVLAVAKQYRDEDFAVAGRPGPQSIGPMLDQGPGTAAEQDSERALGEATAGTAGSDAAPRPEGRAATSPNERGEPGPETSRGSEEPTGGPDEGSGSPGDDTSGSAEGEQSPGDTAEAERSPDANQDPSDTADGSAEQAQEPLEGTAPEQTPPEETEETLSDETPAADEDVMPSEELHSEAVQGPSEVSEPNDSEPNAEQQPGDAAEDREDTESRAGAASAPNAEGDSGRSSPEHAGAGDEPQGRGEPVETSGEGDVTEEEEASAGKAEKADEAEEAEEPVTTTTMTGVLTACADAATQYCLDGELLDLSAADELTTVGDLDGDGVTTSVGEELAGLEAETVELVVVEDAEPLLVVTVNGVALRPA
jgi:hypothetical protein